MYRMNPIMLLLFVACVHQQPDPEWLVHQPVSDDSWYGIASVDMFHDNYRENARTKAIQEIGSQIEIHIKSSIKSVSIEVNYNISEYYESIVESRVDIMLPEVEILDTYTKGKKYFVYTRLKKEAYYRLIELKKEKVISTAIDYMSLADENISVGSFNYLSKALSEITPFMDYPLKAEFPRGSGKQVNLYSTIHILAEEINNRFLLTSDKSEITTTIGISKNHIFHLSCTDKLTNKAVENVPLKVMMNGNNITEDAITNEKGDATLHLFKVTDRTPVQYFVVSVDLHEITGMFNLTYPSAISIKVNAQSPNIYLNIIEKNLNEPVENPFVMPEFKSFLAKTYGAEFTDSKTESDFYVIAEINTTAKISEQNEYGLFQVYADGTISFFDTSTDKELYQKSINNTMGADFHSLEGAGRNALKKLVKKLKTKTFQEIITALDETSNKK